MEGSMLKLRVQRQNINSPKPERGQCLNRALSITRWQYQSKEQVVVFLNNKFFAHRRRHQLLTGISAAIQRSVYTRLSSISGSVPVKSLHLQLSIASPCLNRPGPLSVLQMVDYYQSFTLQKCIQKVESQCVLPLTSSSPILTAQGPQEITTILLQLLIDYF